MLDTKDLEMIAEIMERSLKPVKEDIAEIKQDVAVLKKEMAEVKQDVAVLKQEMAEVKQDIAVLKQDVATLKQEMAEVKQRLSSLEDRVTHLELTLENVTNKQISIIAEGHLDLSRKLDDAVRIQGEMEMIKLRLTALENEVWNPRVRRKNVQRHRGTV